MEHLNHQLKKSKSKHTEMEYLNRIFKVKNSLLKLKKDFKELKDVWSCKMPKLYYKPDPRNYYERYRSTKEPRKTKKQTCAKKSERLHNQIIKPQKKKNE